MWFGILGAPSAWSLQQLINPPLFAHGCYPKDVPHHRADLGQRRRRRHGGRARRRHHLRPRRTGRGWRNWGRTRDEKEGSGHHLMEAGDGRSRFMAMVGLICSGLFLLATVFATAILYMVQPCNG